MVIPPMNHLKHHWNRCRKNNVETLAMPRIGCDIDGLEWNKVSALLEQVFECENLEIVVSQ
ncbi:ADP-ribose glycohydrolase OARD1-like [Drosophila willistoni]|uniref:ADP-ribose glycohydrolase OARD1-like n=1 Tax=Drosophila willistoni TaxID=7260 RepID=UPI001F079500|nr:ADP-ribose glycohydrolase OARD1-like [Drosophila willistoni]